MAKRRPSVDPTIRGCVDRIRRCEYAAIGVLADYLDENRLPWAGTVRRVWNKLQSDVAVWSDYDFSRCRNWTRWEAIAAARRRSCQRVLRLYGRDWTSGRPPLKRFTSNG
jgi:hypothetical protein